MAFIYSRGIDAGKAPSPALACRLFTRALNADVPPRACVGWMATTLDAVPTATISRQGATALRRSASDRDARSHGRGRVPAVAQPRNGKTLLDGRDGEQPRRGARRIERRARRRLAGGRTARREAAHPWWIRYRVLTARKETKVNGSSAARFGVRVLVHAERLGYARLMAKVLRRRVAGWVAIFAILLTALAPAISHALAGTASAPWLEVCTGAGFGSPAMQDRQGDSQLPPGAATLQHCPYCTPNGASFGAPPAAATLVLRGDAGAQRVGDGALPAARSSAWRGTRSRAPPVL